MLLAVIPTYAVPPDADRLTGTERAALAGVHGARRRDEWIRGRLAIRRVLGDDAGSVLAGADGAPVVDGGTARSVSLSHDGGWIAVAAAGAEWRLGIDLCLRAHAERVARILAWLDVRLGTTVDPVAAWCALEVGLKLRRWSIEALRDRALAVLPAHPEQAHPAHPEQAHPAHPEQAHPAHPEQAHPAHPEQAFAEGERASRDEGERASRDEGERASRNVLLVRGLGADVVVRFANAEDFVVAWAREAVAS